MTSKKKSVKKRASCSSGSGQYNTHTHTHSPNNSGNRINAFQKKKNWLLALLVYLIYTEDICIHTHTQTDISEPSGAAFPLSLLSLTFSLLFNGHGILDFHVCTSKPLLLLMLLPTTTTIAMLTERERTETIFYFYFILAMVS